MLSKGVNPMGRDDPRVVNMATVLAPAGMVVMLPYSESMTSDRLVRGFRYLSTVAGVDPERIGMSGFCVGASLVMVAAADEQIRGQVRFVNSFGGYYDASDMMRSVLTASRFSDGRVEEWQPNDLSLKMVRKHLIEGVTRDQDRETLTRTYLQGEQVGETELVQLSPDAEAVHRLLSRPDLEEVEGLLSKLSSATLESLRRISPSAHVGKLQARVLAMHDHEDDLVPSEESRRLMQALDSRNDAYYTEFSFFRHVDPTRAVGPRAYVREALKLSLHMYQIMRQVG